MIDPQRLLKACESMEGWSSVCRDKPKSAYAGPHIDIADGAPPRTYYFNHPDWSESQAFLCTIMTALPDAERGLLFDKWRTGDPPPKTEDVIFETFCEWRERGK